ncbi:unnamed protein product [Miscanthus lutarioriparius]|uniref:Uncharacterized protein n=1 Tax=Miscanthus lutarioriparius TaxID=422564 RepID=A0A811SE24_9POAL|nr:unnamed protein product [Miscanthus lutarioriparius]
MMGEASEAAVALHAGGEDGCACATGGCWVSGSTGSSGIGTASASGSSSSLFSSTTTWSVGDGEEDGDGATSSSRPVGRRHFSSLSSLSSSTSSESEASQMNGAAGGPLYGMLTMQDHLPALRTGLSKYYQGRSESFTSLADVICVEDLAKKTTPYIRRPKASRRHAATLGVKNRLSKTVAKKEPRGRKLAASECQGKLYRC